MNLLATILGAGPKITYFVLSFESAQFLQLAQQCSEKIMMFTVYAILISEFISSPKDSFSNSTISVLIKLKCKY